jgi:hypothetical protein
MNSDNYQTETGAIISTGASTSERQAAAFKKSMDELAAKTKRMIEAAKSPRERDAEAKRHVELEKLARARVATTASRPKASTTTDQYAQLTSPPIRQNPNWPQCNECNNFHRPVRSTHFTTNSSKPQLASMQRVQQFPQPKRLLFD